MPDKKKKEEEEKKKPKKIERPAWFTPLVAEKEIPSPPAGYSEEWMRKKLLEISPHPVARTPAGAEIELKYPASLRAFRELQAKGGPQVPSLIHKPARWPTAPAPAPGGISPIPANVTIAEEARPHMDIAVRENLPIKVAMWDEKTKKTKFLPIEQAPAGEYGGYGGGIIRTEKGVVLLPSQKKEAIRKEREVATAGRQEARSELLGRLQTNPLAAMSKLELALGQKGLLRRDGTVTSTAQTHRHNLARLMFEAGVDPGIATLYATQGLTPDIAQLFAGERARREQIMARGMPGAEGAIRGGSAAFIQQSMKQAKKMGKRAAVVVWPHGEPTVEVFDRPGLGIVGEALYGAFRKGGPQEEIVKALRGEKSAYKDEEIAIIDATPKRIPFGGISIPTIKTLKDLKRTGGRVEEEAVAETGLTKEVGSVIDFLTKQRAR